MAVEDEHGRHDLELVNALKDRGAVRITELTHQEQKNGAVTKVMSAVFLIFRLFCHQSPNVFLRSYTAWEKPPLDFSFRSGPQQMWATG